MTDSISDWAKRLSAEPLPVLRRTLTRVRDLLNQANSSHQALSSVIRHDPGFCLHVFRLLNSLPHQPREPINKLGNAIPMLGMEQIEQAARTLPSLEDKLKGPPRRGLTDCYSRAAHASLYAAELAARRAQRDPQRFATAALLHDIGEMALWSSAPELMRQLQQRVAQGGRREEAELEVLGFTLEELNLKLGEAWLLPPLVQESQGLFNSYLPQPLTVMLAVALAGSSAGNWYSQETRDNLELLAELLKIPVIQAQAQFHQMAAAAARELHHLPLPLPAIGLVLAKAEPAKQTNPSAHSQPSPAETPARPVERGPAPPPPKRPPNPVQEKLNRILRDMQTQLGLQRVMFAMLSPDKTQLKARFVLENPDQASLKGLLLDLQKPSLLVALLKKPQALWVNAANQEKYRPMIPPVARQAFCDKGCLLMSIFIRNSPIGLFYADSGCGNEALTAGQYENFKSLCQQLMKDLG